LKTLPNFEYRLELPFHWIVFVCLWWLRGYHSIIAKIHGERLYLRAFSIQQEDSFKKGKKWWVGYFRGTRYKAAEFSLKEPTSTDWKSVGSKKEE